ncbi:hypothetical protein HFN_1585 [Helicobacter fennelliae MRY12-0050]|uniref:Uncharacterized protein n=1 Tax=Helicobacter fennelliae MRY12-0050 TaxID=1325130 RepID=T1DVR4_9HELI|nr:hypothetical protein HFN_0099 [Helicobacter fennelliae MRY12-0050]GAD20207.1 hypothetical protein HFN_1585 [Helicobacter fennelliae MRY12-0050]
MSLLRDFVIRKIVTIQKKSKIRGIKIATNRYCNSYNDEIFYF